jgi:ABC-type transport system involved in multi-copper enzyme maturation permease subunit
MVDTRAGFWMLLGIVCLTIAALVTVLFAGTEDDHTFKNMFILAALPSAWLLPLAGILLVSSEWSQRTTLITFALVPRRERVLAAKIVAGVALASIALVISLALAALGTAIARPDVDGPWSLSPEFIGQIALYVTASMLMGVGFGATLLSSPPAIVLYLVTPIGFSAIGAIPWFEDIVPWLDWWNAVSILADHSLSPIEWARAGTTLAVWMVLPLLAGLGRITRSEVA